MNVESPVVIVICNSESYGSTYLDGYILECIIRVWSSVEGHRSRVEGHKSRVESRGRKSRSKVENTKFLSILEVLQPLNAAKQLVLLSKLKNFALWLCRMAMPYGYAVWLCRMAMPYGYVVWLCLMAMYCITESFACGTKSLMRGLMFEGIHLLFYIGV